MAQRLPIATLSTALLLAAASGLSIVLRFDGSLRPPIDSVPGFTYAPITFDGDASRPLEGSDRFASCGAAVSIIEDGSVSIIEDGGERLVALGGRYLPNDIPGRTSADAEYAGLILGLEWLVGAFSPRAEDASDTSIATLDGCALLASSELIIRGDCKAVIDQMNGRSVPRKTEAKHELAAGMLASLKDRHAEYQREAPTQDLAISFEHVLREENSLCDEICKLIVYEKQSEIEQSIQDTILLGEEEASNRANDNAATHTKTSRKKRDIRPKSEHFQRALDDIRRNPRLCHSSRVALACELAEACVRTNDAAVLDGCGDFFGRVHRAWPRIYYGNDLARRDAAKKAGIECATLSKQFAVGLDAGEKEGNAIAQLLNFCASSRSGDGVSDGIEEGWWQRELRSLCKSSVEPDPQGIWIESPAMLMV